MGNRSPGLIYSLSDYADKVGMDVSEWGTIAQRRPFTPSNANFYMRSMANHRVDRTSDGDPCLRLRTKHLSIFYLGKLALAMAERIITGPIAR